MGVGSIVVALRRLGISSVDLSLGERVIALSRFVEFRVHISGTTYADTISQVKAIPYSLTGSERINYEEVWAAACRRAGPDPLTYLGSTVDLEYQANIPNALHLTAGWLEKLRAFIGMSKGEIEVGNVGSHRYEPECFEHLASLVTPDFYQGFLEEVAVPRL